MPSTYTATHPQITANPGAALGGKQPCPVAKERIHGTVTCAAQEPLAACALRHADPSGLINDTDRCRLDPQLDVPRQWLHVTGDFPPDAPAGQVQYDVDGTGCAMAIGGLVVKIGGAYLTGGSTTVSPWSFVPAGATAVWKCLPRVQQPQGIDHFIPGGEFVGALPAMYAMNDETAVDVTGEVCSRSISYEWVYTIEAVIYNWADGIPYDAYSIDSIALSNRRYRSGGRVVIVGTEPCVCAQPGETDPKGLDCSTFTNRQRLLSPWKVTDASSVVGHCDFRGCDCTPAEDPVTYTGDLPPHPCPPVMPPMVPPTTEPPPTYPPPVMPPMTSTPTTPPPTYPPPVMPPMTSTPTAPPPMYPAPGPGSGMTP